MSLGKRNPAIAAINKGTFVVLVFVLSIALGVSLNYKRITANYTEVHDWKNHVEGELIKGLEGYVPYGGKK